jgi:hypothetical protein
MASGIGGAVTAELVRRSVPAVAKVGGVFTLFRESSVEDIGDHVIPQPVLSVFIIMTRNLVWHRSWG